MSSVFILGFFFVAGAVLGAGIVDMLQYERIDSQARDIEYLSRELRALRTFVGDEAEDPFRGHSQKGET